MKNVHNFIIGANESPEGRIEKEIQEMREIHQEFKMVSINVFPSVIGASTATMTFTATK